MSEPRVPDITMTPVPVESSNLGPIVLGCLAFFILAQGIVYIIRPEMTGRSVTAGKKKIRIVGSTIIGFSLIIFYLAYSMAN